MPQLVWGGLNRASGLASGSDKFLPHGQVSRRRAVLLQQQQAWRIILGGYRPGSQVLNAAKDAAVVVVYRDPSFGVECSQGDTYRPLVLAEFAQGIYRELEAFADAHAGRPEQQQSLGAQGRPFEEPPLQPLVVFGRERLWGGMVGRGGQSRRATV